METLKEFISIITPKTIAVCSLSILATVVCVENNLSAEIPVSLIGLTVVFPLVFTIAASFNRRDLALQQYGRITANLSSIFMTAEYHQQRDPKQKYCDLRALRQTIMRLLELIKLDLIDSSSSTVKKTEIYQQFRFLFSNALPLKPVCNVDFFLTDTIACYETLSSISDYRTPRGLKAYSKIFLTIFPVIFAPYFASISQELYISGLVVSFFYSFVLTMLSNVQDNLENPFDNRGLDDLNFDRENRFLNSI